MTKVISIYIYETIINIEKRIVMKMAIVNRDGEAGEPIEYCGETFTDKHGNICTCTRLVHSEDVKHTGNVIQESKETGEGIRSPSPSPTRG